MKKFEIKKLFLYIFGILFIVIFVSNLIILLKPGASFFYRKYPIKISEINKNGSIIEYTFAYPEKHFPPESVLLVQDKKPLVLSSNNSLGPEDYGTYVIEDLNEKSIAFRFIPNNDAEQSKNMGEFQVYIRPFPLSSNLGGAGVLFLTFGFIGFLFFLYSNPKISGTFSKSSNKFVHLLNRMMDKAPWNNSLEEKKPSFLFIRASVFTILAAYALTLMEWLFLITKPSYLDILDINEKIRIFLTTSFIFASIGMIALTVIFLFDRIFFKSRAAFRNCAYYFPAVFLFTCLGLLLIDNFTYTIFNFGIVDSRTLLRIIYAIIVVVIFLYILIKISTVKIKQAKSTILTPVYLFSFILCGISFIVFILSYQSKNPIQNQYGSSGKEKTRPNIILFGTDGLNAKNMSVYGYERNTTPFIIELAQDSLVAENHFTNSAKTLGSTVSILTGKLPFSTRVLRYPDILRNNNSYQHLPGILQRMGYKTISIGVPRYVDLNSINLQPPVDSVNCIETPKNRYKTLITGRGFDDEIHFFNLIIGRITERVGHLFFIQDMQNPIDVVTDNTAPRLDDQEKLDCLFSNLDNTALSGQPLFAHVHLIGTHGERFYPSNQVFSKGETQDKKWMTDFYDDSILDYDQEVATLVQHLKSNNQYQDTVIVLFSDHGQNWTSENEIPLIMHFNNNEHAGIITENTQNIDIAPTLLNYLGIIPPNWMEGESLLEKIDPYRLIYSAGEIPNKSAGIPPFFQFGSVTAIQCQNYFKYDLTNLTITQGEVDSYKTPCPEEDLDSENIVLSKINSLLKKFGFHSQADY